ncbi:TnsA-like heteromeric transposase endonuclease subunit [Nocardia brasiliensis]|uniref:TnsA-like heteromeric transposase endonuclease subunit n=1 Tax=Nocardia brasiliensis TaxID=37326 RepID=A0A6G9Y3Z2_NOCBR|nr:TnsA-like heteromeric transposase endonuclease subunit [Nocardia brasiliensis]
MSAASPWRTFRWHHGQKHYSGTYWSATQRGHVIYESRLELARLLFADFDRSVRRVVAQPFLLRVEIGGKLRRHIPDFLLLTDSGPLVVDVKPADRLQNPKVAFTFEWTEEVLTARGWRYEVFSEPDAVELENVRFLAGYRRDWLFDPDILRGLRSLVTTPVTIGDVLSSTTEVPVSTARAALMHLLWRQEFVVNMSSRLRSTSLLWVA